MNKFKSIEHGFKEGKNVNKLDIGETIWIPKPYIKNPKLFSKESVS